MKSGRILGTKVLFLLLFTWNGTHAAAAVKVGLVLDKGGRDDKSFNAAAYQGAKEAEAKLGITLKVVEASDDTAIEPSLRTFAQKGYDLVFGIGFAQTNALKKVAAEFPKVHFVLIDQTIEAPNVRSVAFKENEGSFLVGVIAALVSKTRVVGFVGGMDVPLIRKFEAGYRAGALAANPKVNVITNYVGSTSDAWRNPTKAKELALSQYQRNADVIFAASGASNMGVFDAAEEKKKYAIGCDANQNWVKPGRIATSMLKRVDVAVFQAIEAKAQNKFVPGPFSLGLKEKGVDYAIDDYNRSLIAGAPEKKAEEFRKAIVSGKISVPDSLDPQVKP